MTGGQSEGKIACEECLTAKHPFVWSGSYPMSDDWRWRCFPCDEKFQLKKLGEINGTNR